MDYNQDNNYHFKFFITQLFQLIEDVSTRNADNNDDPIKTYENKIPGGSLHCSRCFVVHNTRFWFPHNSKRYSNIITPKHFILQASQIPTIYHVFLYTNMLQETMPTYYRGQPKTHIAPQNEFVY